MGEEPCFSMNAARSSMKMHSVPSWKRTAVRQTERWLCAPYFEISLLHGQSEVKGTSTPSVNAIFSPRAFVPRKKQSRSRTDLRPLTGASLSMKYLKESSTSADCASRRSSASSSMASISGSASGFLLHGMRISRKRLMCVPLYSIGSATVKRMRARTCWKPPSFVLIRKGSCASLMPTRWMAMPRASAWFCTSRIRFPSSRSRWDLRHPPQRNRAGAACSCRRCRTPSRRPCSSCA